VKDENLQTPVVQNPTERTALAKTPPQGSGHVSASARMNGKSPKLGACGTGIKSKTISYWYIVRAAGCFPALQCSRKQWMGEIVMENLEWLVDKENNLHIADILKALVNSHTATWVVPFQSKCSRELTSPAQSTGYFFLEVIENFESYGAVDGTVSENSCVEVLIPRVGLFVIKK
jgi:hypothetical protein